MKLLRDSDMRLFLGPNAELAKLYDTEVDRGVDVFYATVN